jgi:hypothetical protein
MPYFPKSQIKANLYTSGEEFYIVNTSTFYKGYYYKLGNGKYYSGKSPSTTNPTTEIIPINQSDKFSTNSFTGVPSYEDNTDPNNPVYGAYPTQFLPTNYPKFQPGATKFTPYYNPMLPTPQEYQIGEFRRYFCKKTNEIKYIETDKNIYDSLINKSPSIEFSLYLPFYLDWQLTGVEEQVARVNKNNAELTAQRLKLPGLLEYLRFDFTKYYK